MSEVVGTHGHFHQTGIVSHAGNVLKAFVHWIMRFQLFVVALSCCQMPVGT